jgi:hypothetical protein
VAECVRERDEPVLFVWRERTCRRCFGFGFTTGFDDVVVVLAFVVTAVVVVGAVGVVVVDVVVVAVVSVVVPVVVVPGAAA